MRQQLLALYPDATVVTVAGQFERQVGTNSYLDGFCLRPTARGTAGRNTTMRISFRSRLATLLARFKCRILRHFEFQA